jgi:hypothetical protein
MYWYFIGLSGVASGFLYDFIRGRTYGHESYDWSFVHNRQALVLGATVGVFIVATTLGSGWHNTLLSIIPALLVGSLVALSIHRYHRRQERHGPKSS